ncbi:RNA methyltransferase [Inhella gelatinilytica]|uniref:tRNA (cytidine/uridine-2'-O-)-methyltransferase TrmJ n=1 Tax=Inhella gelatinilytica TaxID=2795030 RepID=A0A931IUA6_9BURK|nr:RNA methyltransferase [Inhella gelatinilytica]MBH9552907.1 RNA methyltransferase [Inhella gelatinilytica]
MNPSHPGNVGAAARALKVMGFRELVLVRPRFADVLTQPETIAFASGATDVLSAARVVGSFEEAVAGMQRVVGTAMTPRDFGPACHAPRPLFEAWATESQVPSLALVFGSERLGLSNEDVYRCHAVVSIPTAPDYGSLNLAQAVQLLAYEWRQALGGFPVQARTAPPDLADAQAVQGLLRHWERALIQIGFLDPAAPKKLMPRLNQLFNRAGVQSEEVHILRGIARAMQKSASANPGSEMPRT